MGFERRLTHEQVIHRLEDAVDSGHTMAHFHLAECRYHGLEIDPNPIKAVELYLDLAERGIPQAQVALGGCYEDGKGVNQDFDSAIEWYSRAADQGSEDARLHIVFLRGWLSFVGRSVEQSNVDAFNHWQEASTQSTSPIIKPIATYMLGWMHYLGRGTVRDQQKGVKIIRENESGAFPLGEFNSFAAMALSSSTCLCCPDRCHHCGSDQRQDDGPASQRVEWVHGDPARRLWAHG